MFGELIGMMVITPFMTVGSGPTVQAPKIPHFLRLFLAVFVHS